ncbi:MurR/RpiR family transcriptional regulator [Bacillus badius]|uniref:Transcriptional regulator, RpiR family n=1 Tax=Bacillus badius TaxID=1455 RepID=A0ABR5B054_BACBA|nr:MurR/RpiR family transcriptional regulator [Bacillus badius]KIL73325.1 Transcriptional regulator, RpiR family [Bacillus badius]KIL80334.1 Transcriptional regulator, RpiR family [Bacillus badius]KZR56768.1 transcriptional regulator [Bacillus badius]MED4716899.1 MurR/RpiR family transcriptional regulator [Bacillus badius]UAT31606.1 MurR/RpiR family transcriptional regulator [Bacillus badius]
MEILDLIKEKCSSLSKSQQKVGKYVLHFPEKVALLPASEVGKQTSVSETTVIRFCYSLGLKGYAHLQSIIREYLIQHQSSLSRYYSSKMEMAQQPHFFAQVMQKDKENIQRVIDTISEEEIQLAVNKIMNAKNVFLTGMRTSFAPAQWFAFTLGLVRDHVKLIQPGLDDLVTILQNMDQESVFIGITFHRYVKETVHIAEMAKKRGVFVISLTDSASAPVAEFSDLVLGVGSQENSTLDVFPPLFSLLNAMMAGLYVQYSEEAGNRQEKYEQVNADHLFYF